MPLDVEKIRRLREAAGLTLAAAAAAAGFNSRQRWYEIEAGAKPDVRVSTLEAVAAVLGVPPGDLLKSKRK